MNWQRSLAKWKTPFSALTILMLLATSIIQAAGKTEKTGLKKPNGPGAMRNPGPVFSADRVRFQQQAAFGYSTSLDDTIRLSDIPTYINAQIGINPANPTTPFPNDDLQPTFPRAVCNGYEGDPDDPQDSPIDCFRDTYSMHPMQRWLFKEAVYGTPQLRLRVAWALSQIWVISGNEIKQSRHMTEYFKILYKHALGTPNTQGEDYFNLMKDMTLNPGMGEYLDMSVSTADHRNENYARELLQLFTTGVDEFNPDGTIKIVNGRRVPVYTQPIVEDFARVFTGWSFCNEGCTNSLPGKINFIDQMSLNALNHNLEGKSLLNGQSILPCINGCSRLSDKVTYANNSLNLALRNIFDHPNVPFFVSRQLIQHLVMSNPSDAYVARVAAKFANNGNNVRGDMKEVVKAILLDSEARGDSKEGPGYETYGKLKEPVQYAANIMRAFNAKGTDPGTRSDGVIFYDPTFLKMSQNPFYAPSVFNFYSPHNKILNGTVSAPEFALMTATTAVGRLNFANTMTFSGIPNDNGSPPPGGYSTYLDLSEMEVLAANSANLVLALNQRLMHGTMTANTQTEIVDRLDEMITEQKPPLERAKEAVYLAITSTQYQVQR